MIGPVVTVLIPWNMLEVRSLLCLRRIGGFRKDGNAEGGEVNSLSVDSQEGDPSSGLPDARTSRVTTGGGWLGREIGGRISKGPFHSRFPFNTKRMLTPKEFAVPSSHCLNVF